MAPIKNNRVYIASKVGPMEQSVKNLKAKLESRGFEIIYDWTELPAVKPFEENIRESAAAAEAMAQAVIDCDICIVLFVESGIGFHIETGGALVASIVQSQVKSQIVQKKIYIVGEGNTRSIFYFHPLVTRLPDVEVLLDVLKHP